jgi:hypothetical protein
MMELAGSTTAYHIQYLSNLGDLQPFPVLDCCIHTVVFQEMLAVVLLVGPCSSVSMTKVLVCVCVCECVCV